MIEIFKTLDKITTPIDEIQDGTWISLTNPTQEEMEKVAAVTEVDIDMIKAALDEEEASRIEVEDGVTLMIMDVPYATSDDDRLVTFETIPMGLIVTKDHMISVCLKTTLIMNDMISGAVRQVDTGFHTRFTLQLLFRLATRYLMYLKQIDRMSNRVERELHKSMKNKELIQLLDLEKSLVYFNTSLRGNMVTIEKLQRGRYLKMYEEDQELLEDVLIEFRQAVEMSDIYTNILSGTMDAFASIISNNLNIVMRILTVITILMAVPTMVASFYGMNVDGIPLPNFWFVLALSMGFMIVIAFILYRKKML